MYLYKHILKSSVTMLRALYDDFDACSEHYMYILKALLKALKGDLSSIIRQGLDSVCKGYCHLETRFDF